VCAGAKSILDIPRTLEILETLGVPVVGYGCDTFPGFYLRTTGEPVSARVDDPVAVARLLAGALGPRRRGVVIAQPVDAEAALVPGEVAAALIRAEERGANGRDSRAGSDAIPVVSTRRATQGRSLHANRALIVANAGLAAQIAGALCAL